MIKNLINKLLNKLTLHYCLKKYNGIWGFKNYLSQNDIKNARLLENFDAYFDKYGSWIGVKSQFAGIPCFPHQFYGIFIAGGAKLGKNVVIFQHVTIGSNTLDNSKNAGSPTIGDNVYIGAGAKIIGKIVIGDNCRVGANTVVYQDMPPNSVAVQVPTQIIQKSNLDNRFYCIINGSWAYFDDGDWIKVQDRNI